MVAPPERLAAFRAIANGFATAYLLIRAPMFVDLGDRAAADFDPVGLKLPDHRGFEVKSQQHFSAPKTAGHERPSPDPDLFIAIRGNAANHDICAHFAGKT